MCISECTAGARRADDWDTGDSPAASPPPGDYTEQPSTGFWDGRPGSPVNHYTTASTITAYSPTPGVRQPFPVEDHESDSTYGRQAAMTMPRRRAYRRRPPQPRGRTIRTSPPSAHYSGPVCFSHRAPRGAVTTGFGRGIAPGARQQRSPARQRRSSLSGFSSPPTPLPIATSSRRSWHRRYPRRSPHHTPRRKRR